RKEGRMKRYPFRLVVLPGANPPEEIRADYERAYTHWSSVWDKTFKELDRRKIQLFSDDFTRQDEIFAIFHEPRCVAMVCHRFVDLSLESSRRDSYFKVWTPEAMEGLVKHGTRIMIGNQISVDPEYRGLVNGLSLKTLVTAFTMMRIRQINI